MNETFICVAGDNIVYYDVGFLDANGGFVPTALAAFSQIVTVLRGSPSKFTLSCIQRMTEKTQRRCMWRSVDGVMWALQ